MASLVWLDLPLLRCSRGWGKASPTFRHFPVGVSKYAEVGEGLAALDCNMIHVYPGVPFQHSCEIVMPALNHPSRYSGEM